MNESDKTPEQLQDEKFRAEFQVGGVDRELPAEEQLEHLYSRNRPEIRDALVETAPVPVDVQENRSSDHWSYEKAGIPAARLGSISFSGYHSPADVPSVIDPAQLEATADVVWAWLRALEA